MQHNNSTKAILSVLLFVLIIGCSTNDNPVCVQDIQRSAATFKESWTLFSDDEINYNEVDLSTLMHGPDSAVIGQPVATTVLFDERHWCLALTAEDNQVVKYAWLDDVTSPGQQTPYQRALSFPALGTMRTMN